MCIVAGLNTALIEKKYPNEPHAWLIVPMTHFADLSITKRHRNIKLIVKCYMTWRLVNPKVTWKKAFVQPR